MNTERLALVLGLFASSLAFAQPAPDASPAATPEATATPIATPDAPAATPIATPDATPPSPAPTPDAPAATPAPVVTATPAPAPVRAGAPDDDPGTRDRERLGRLRGFAAAGGHVFFGKGWNEDAETPDQDPPQSRDYAGGALRAGLLWEVTEHVVLGGQLGGHQGRHALGDEEADPEPVAIAYGLYYGAASVRWQSKPAAAGGYVEAGAGMAAGRVVVTRPDDADDEEEDELTPTMMGFLALGATGQLAPGVDLFVEARWMTAPDAAESFTSDADLDLGGLTGTIGLLLRL